MNWKRMKVVAAVPVALAVTAGAVQLGISYRNGNGFHPFGTDREMKNNQILFPDSQESTGKQTDQTGEDDSSFLEKDNNKEDKAQQGNSSTTFLTERIPLTRRTVPPARWRREMGRRPVLRTAQTAAPLGLTVYMR